MRILTVVAFLLCLFAADIIYAAPLKKKQVPAAARKAFKKQYRKTKPTWERASETVGVYEASFKKGTTAMVADYDSTGQWILSATEISPDSIPAAVTKALSLAEYSKWPIAHTHRASNPMYPELYRVTFRQGNEEIAALLLPSGNMLRKTERKVQ